MAAKKYLSLDEAAEVLAMPASQLNKLREKGELRGFADRGTWKFKTGDIEEFARTRQVSSDPDVPLLPDDDPYDTGEDEGSSITMPAFGGGGEPSIEINMGSTDDALADDALADEPTLVRGAGAESDSDVRLAVDDAVGSASDGSDAIDLSDGDSDVRLVGDAGGKGDSGDAGAASDSDVRLIADEPSSVSLDAGSDSDVALVPGGGSSAAGSGIALDSAVGDSGVGGSVLDDDQPAGGPEDSQLTLGNDSGIALSAPADSGVSLGDDSGLALADSDPAPDASGEEVSSIILGDDGGDSGIALAGDSSAKTYGADDLEGEDGSSIILLGDDSGLALSGDSGSALDGSDLSDEGSGAFGDSGVADSGIALDFLNEEDDGPAPTKSLVAAGAGAAGAAAAGAATEADLATAESDTFAVAADDEAGGADTSVILFEDDDDDFGDVPAGAAGDNTSQFELEEDFDDFGDDQTSAVSAEILADDDDDLDVFEAGDDDFDDDFQSGASHAEFAPVGLAARAPEAEFDPVTVSLLGAGTLLMLLVGVLAFDLVRSMWGYNEPNVFSQTILDTVGSSLYGP